MFYGVVGNDSVRISLFLGILNQIMACAADCSNAILHVRIHDNYNFIAGSECGKFKGHKYNQY